MRLRILLTALAVLMLAVPAMADHHESGEMEMPPMGPPAEMKELAYLEGDWDVAMKYTMAPGQDWIESTGTCTYEFVLGGGALHSSFKGEMMGMPMTGYQIMTYDREQQRYESIWIDSMACRTSETAGQLDGDTMVFTGTDLHMGAEYEMKLTTTKKSDDMFTFVMDMSMDGGENWFTGMKMTYTKKSGAR